MKKKFTAMVLGTCLMMGLVGCGDDGGASSDGKMTIKLSTVVSENNITASSLELLKSRLAEESDGRIDVQIFYSGQLGGDIDALKQVSAGDIQMSTCNPASISNSIKPLAALESVFMFDDWDHAMRFLDSEGGDAMLDTFNAMHAEGLIFLPNGFRQFSNSKQPIETMEDFKGLKVRGYSEPQIKTWEAVGANMSSVSWNELFTSLQQNLIDAQECAVVSLYDAKLYEVQDYISFTNHQLSMDVLVAGQEFMNSLSDEDKAIFDTVLKEVSDNQRKVQQEQEQVLLDEIIATGVQVNDIDPAEIAKMRETISAVLDPTLIEIAGQENYDIVQQYLEETRQ